MLLSVEEPLLRASFRLLTEEDGPTTPDSETLCASLEAARCALQAAKARVPQLTCTERGKQAWARAVAGPVATEAAPFRCQVGLPPVSRAYHKMREILLSCALSLPEGQARTVHLCEAPGGFIQAVGDLGVERRWWPRAACPSEEPAADLPWRWVGHSLAEGKRAPAAKVDGLPMDYGTFLEGDLLHNPEAEADRILQSLQRGGNAEHGAHLVTADGAVEMDHCHLEREHLPLLLAQCCAACRLLEPDGTFVLKYFEGVHHATACVLAKLTHAFSRVSLIKPTSSRPTNSERYVVARGFGNREPEHRTLRWWATPMVLAEPWCEAYALHAERQARTQTEHLKRCLRQAM